jgi:hypothetical protein
MTADASPIIRTGGHAPIPESQLWIGLAGGPAAFSLQELLGWFVGARVCEGWSLGTVRWAVAAIAIVAIAVSAWAFMLSWRNWHRASAPPSPPVEARDRQAFMALGGALISAMFVIATFWAGLTAAFLDTCGWMR